MKKKILVLSFAAAALAIAAIGGCQKETPIAAQLGAPPTLPAEPYLYANEEAFTHLGLGGVSSVNNQVATLGRVLFYDTRLSLNNAIACASCHHQSRGFADFSAVSTGFLGRKTTRNSLPIANAAMSNNLFWDSRTPDLNTLVLQPVQNHIEMGMESLDMLKTKLANTAFYPPLFEQAFGTPDVTEERISTAVAQFLTAMVSYQSKYDAGLMNGFQNFTELEKKGHEIFFGNKAKCGSCHMGVNLGALSSGFGIFDNGGIDGGMIANDSIAIDCFGCGFNPYHQTGGTTNIGLDVEYSDNGRGEGHFKIPSLRNIALTAPYMHDGRFNTLDEVINHYSEGIKRHKKLDIKFVGNDGQVAALHLTSYEKQALKAFLLTLTDEHFVSDPKFSNPF